MKRFLQFALVFVLSAILAVPALAAPVKLPTCWMAEAPGFLVWYAKKMGWDKAEGLDIEMLLFDTGPAQMEALPSKTWRLGSTGIGGQLVGGIRHKIYVVAPIVTEGYIHDSFLRPGHPATQVKGWNPDFPNVYGSPETVKGMEILYTAQTTTHYMIGNYLSIFGLTPEDVKLVNMDGSAIVPAFERGIGDLSFLWMPFTFAASAKGWPSAGNMADMGAPSVSAIVADAAWADANPDQVAKFMRMYFRGVNMLNEEGVSDRIVAEYIEYMNEFGGIRMSTEDAKADLNARQPRWTLEETLTLMDKSQGVSTAEQWQFDVADFFAEIGRFTPQEVKVYKDSNLNTDKFLKMIELPIPSWK